jgi:hypothetical protein
MLKGGNGAAILTSPQDGQHVVPRDAALLEAVCTENSNPNVVMVKPAEDRV